MTATEQIIRDAIKGGWEYHGTLEEYNEKQEYLSDDEKMSDLYIAILDLEFWKAVGKTRGWSDTVSFDTLNTDWITEWHSFIDHLADGKSIEDSLSML